jgi:hypothetical protein
MVVKSMSRKTMSFLKLIEYIAREGRAEGMPVVHNLSADGKDLDKVNRAFMQNARHCPPRKNGVLLYHEILSLSPEDKSHATPEILIDLAERYLSQRACGAMAWGMVHFDKNPHIHLIISANLRGQAKKLRLSRKAFSELKHNLEIYQKEKYPALSRSIVFDEDKKKRREVKQKTMPLKVTQKSSEQAREKRLASQGRGVLSQKEILHQQILDALTASESLEAFTAHLQRQGITLYERSGRLAGIISKGKKYRFRTLGLETALEASRNRWKQLLQRRQSLRDILAEKARYLFREFGIAQRIRDILESQEGKERAGQHPRLDTLRQILHKKRQQCDPHDRGREVF